MGNDDEGRSRHSGLKALALLSLGVSAGWFLSGPRRRAAGAAGPPRAFSALIRSSNGATWGNLASFAIRDLPVPSGLLTGATLADLSALQDQLDRAAAGAHAAIVADPASATDPAILGRAIEINQKANQVDLLLAAKAVSLVGNDIGALKAQADKMTAVAAEIPGATRKLEQADAFLSAATAVIRLLG